MCGIVCLLDAKQNTETLRPQVLEMSKKVRHRGSDWSGIFQNEKAILSHERLAIVDPTSGKQPLYSKDGKVVLAVNGEIYNHKELRSEFPDYEFLTESDCEVILALYRRDGKDFLDKLNGIFAFALYDIEKDLFLIGRDHMGICPLYQGWDKNGNYLVASELKDRRTRLASAPRADDRPGRAGRGERRWSRSPRTAPGARSRTRLR